MNSVKNMIDKNVRLLTDGTIGLTDEEKFVNEKLQVPAEWLFYSKAVLAFSLNKFVWFDLQKYLWLWGMYSSEMVRGGEIPSFSIRKKFWERFLDLIRKNT